MSSKKLILTTFIIVCLAQGCNNLEKGYCQPVDPATGCGGACSKETTRKKCEEYNEDKKDGKKWRFFEGELPCAPDAPNPTTWTCN